LFKKFYDDLISFYFKKIQNNTKTKKFQRQK